ncbi:hypothetical protein C1Y63_10500 [Corynebacterium sp. 13CS0277]|uniref:hypothetical protein n=1 Tax=Corynebacterium sp. 13CS0277 TaxID=2071994 RepID=UPI000D036663|nr:hypothetical protein [Corynebacterium sp. 13CS0277]PRQ10616.1 hypothetical protein C1Y63_10500 [Corynebacterium sp. 13CS0277]
MNPAIVASRLKAIAEIAGPPGTHDWETFDPPTVMAIRPTTPGHANLWVETTRNTLGHECATVPIGRETALQLIAALAHHTIK